MWTSIKHEHIGPLIIIMFLLTLGFSQLQGMYALFAQAKFNIGPKEIGIVLFVLSHQLEGSMFRNLLKIL